MPTFEPVTLSGIGNTLTLDCALSTGCVDAGKVLFALTFRKPGVTCCGVITFPPIASYRCTIFEIDVLRLGNLGTSSSSGGGGSIGDVGGLVPSVDLEGNKNIDCGRERVLLEGAGEVASLAASKDARDGEIGEGAR